MKKHLLTKHLLTMRSLADALEDGNFHTESMLIHDFINLVLDQEVTDSKDTRIIAKWLIDRDWFEDGQKFTDYLKQIEEENKEKNGMDCS